MLRKKTKAGVRLLGVLLALGLLLIAFSGCTKNASSGSQVGESKGTLTMGVTPWATTVPPTYAVKTILEELGYKIKLVDAEVGVVFAGLSKGDIDIFLDAWLPDTHKIYMDKYGANIEEISMSYDDGIMGWVVPTYVKDVNSLADLKAHKKEFEGKIIGIDAGAGMMKTTKEMIEAYGLDYQLVESSEAAMLTVLKGHYQQKKPVITLGYRPHSMFAQWDLKFLEDPKNFFKPSEVWTLGHKGLAEKAPQAYAFLKNWNIPIGDVEKMIMKLEMEKADPDQMTKQWIKDNRDKVDAMLKNIK